MAKERWSKSDVTELVNAWNNKPKGETITSFSRRLSTPQHGFYSVKGKIAWLMDEGEIEASVPEVLFMDIETLPIIGAVWQPYQADVLWIERDWCVATWAAKWMGSKRMMSDSLTEAEIKRRDDKRVTKTLWHLFERADIVIAQNGKKFDIPKMNSRWWLHNYGPPSSYKIVDTLLEARLTFGQTYNSLDELGKYLGVGGKMRTGGKYLWKDFEALDPEARRKMVLYNERDVDLLERVYEKMRPWMKNHPALNDAEFELCPVCGDVNRRHIGFYLAKVKRYKEYRCGNCKHIWHDGRAEK